ncbi:MAG TPA: VTT domain-containing protein [Candidatus Acidoferrales bacterium]|nr:VTT domain-containing protein [Candidatus Acidoferrales bacterium]
MRTCWVRRAEAGLIFIASFVLAALVIRYKWHVEAALITIGPWAYPLAIALFALVASAPFSVTDALAIMNGVIFGPVLGSIVNAIGIVFAAVMGYALAKRTAHLLDLDKQIERLPSWIRRFRVGSPAFLLSVRVIPGLGGTLATQSAAAFRVPLFVHVWTMCVVAIPVCTILAIFGDRASAAVHDYYEAYYRAHRPHVHMRMPHMHVHIPERLLHFFRHSPSPDEPTP